MSGIVVAIGLAVLIGWAFDVSLLKAVHSSFVTMKANTALLFICLGIGLWLTRGDRRRGTRLFLGVVLCLVAGATLAQYLLRTNFGIDEPGVGFPAELDFQNTTSLGMQLVCGLTKQLRGTVKLSREGGTRFEIRFPVTRM